MVFLIFSVLAFLVLWMSRRVQFRTTVFLAVAVGLAADFLLDLLLALRR
jgi:hypothetical protein